MSVTTTADIHLCQIIQDLKKVEQDLSEWYFDDEQWGRDEYSSAFEERIQQAIFDLRKIRKSIQ